MTSYTTDGDFTDESVRVHEIFSHCPSHFTKDSVVVCADFATPDQIQAMEREGWNLQQIEPDTTGQKQFKITFWSTRMKKQDRKLEEAKKIFLQRKVYRDGTNKIRVETDLLASDTLAKMKELGFDLEFVTIYYGIKRGNFEAVFMERAK